MTIETILKTDVLDIVFEKRNKLYGAYPLRKFYKNRLFGALTITIGAATILSAFTFIRDETISDPVTPENPAIDEITNNPDIQASYPGGINALKKFLERNLINPTEMEPGEMVSVNVKFVVDFDGKLQNFAVVKDGGEIFNKEVIRVLKKMPQWVPGKSNGKNVPVYFVIPIKFVPAE